MLFLCSRSCASASLSSAFTASSVASLSSAERSVVSGSFFATEARPPSFRRTSFETPLTTHIAREPARPATSSLGDTPKGGVEARRALASSAPFFASRGARGGLPLPLAGFCGARFGSAEEERLAFANDRAGFSFPEGASPSVFQRPLFGFAGFARSFLPGARRRAASTSTAIARGACARSTDDGDDGLFWLLARSKIGARFFSDRPTGDSASQAMQVAPRIFFPAERNARTNGSFSLSPETSGSRSPLRHLRARDSRRGKLPTARRTRARSSTRG